MPCYENDGLIMTVACYKNGNDDNNSDKNEDKICLLPRR